MGAASTMRVRALEKLAAACYRRVNGRHARDVTRGIVGGADASSFFCHSRTVRLCALLSVWG